MMMAQKNGEEKNALFRFVVETEDNFIQNPIRATKYETKALTLGRPPRT